jgi:aspartyl-tRNA synthetase
MSDSGGTTGTTAVPVGLRSDYCGTLGDGDVGRSVAVCGWVAHRREHGEHLAFVDLRDHTGLIQCVVDGAQALRAEYVVRVTGTVRARPPGRENPLLPTGFVEIGDAEVEILSVAEPPPFLLDGHSEAD